MPELGSYGSVRGAVGNSRPYRKCRPMKVARRAPGPAYANLQWRKPREVWRGGASDAVGIWRL